MLILPEAHEPHEPVQFDKFTTNRTHAALSQALRIFFIMFDRTFCLCINQWVLTYTVVLTGGYFSSFICSTSNNSLFSPLQTINALNDCSNISSRAIYFSIFETLQFCHSYRLRLYVLVHMCIISVCLCLRIYRFLSVDLLKMVSNFIFIFYLAQQKEYII